MNVTDLIKLEQQANALGYTLVKIQNPSGYNEPSITINGKTCHDGEAMTLRVAIEDLAVRMSKKNCLGKDEMGESIRKGYMDSVYSIRTKMYGTGEERAIEEDKNMTRLHGPDWKDLLKSLND